MSSSSPHSSSPSSLDLGFRQGELWERRMVGRMTLSVISGERFQPRCLGLYDMPNFFILIADLAHRCTAEKAHHFFRIPG